MSEFMRTHEPVKPVPPSKELLSALRPPRPAGEAASKPETRASDALLGRIGRPSPTEQSPFLKFEFKRPWSGEYTTKDYKFVLRVEHFDELKRLVEEFNKTRGEDEFPIGVSDVVSAALDFVLDHPVILTGLGSAEQVRDAMARAVYRKAMFRFIQLYELC